MTVGGGALDDAAAEHDDHLVGERAHDAEIVADEEDREPHVGLEVLEQVDDLRLDRDVERRGRLVGDQHRDAEDQRAGDRDALALAAGELVRVAAGVARIEPDALEPLPRVVAPLRGRVEVVDRQRLGDDLAERHHRIERGVAVLEHHLHLPPVGFQVALRDGRDVLAVEEDRPRRRVEEAEREQSGRGLAGAGFADERNDIILRQRQVDAVDREVLPRLASKETAARQRKTFADLPEFEGGRAAHAVTSADAAVGTRMQAARRPGALASSGGTICRHSTTAIGQRGWNGQPGGG